MFADDTSIPFTHSNFMEFHVNIETVLGNVNMSFKNCLSLNINPLALELDIYSLAHHLCKM